MTSHGQTGRSFFGIPVIGPRKNRLGVSDILKLPSTPSKLCTVRHSFSYRGKITGISHLPGACLLVPIEPGSWRKSAAGESHLPGRRLAGHVELPARRPTSVFMEYQIAMQYDASPTACYAYYEWKLIQLSLYCCHTFNLNIVLYPPTLDNLIRSHIHSKRFPPFLTAIIMQLVYMICDFRQQTR